MKMNNQDLIDSMPRHIGIIMDGNGRWAKKRNLPRPVGHKAGVEKVREIVKCCSKLNIEALSLYAFSTENWKRPKYEVDALMSLFVEYINKEIKELNENNVKMRFMGNIDQLSKRVQKSIDFAVDATKDNSGLTLNIALNYGSRDDILSAAKAIAEMAMERKLMYNKDGCLEIDESLFASCLKSNGLPELDLIIRTSGEQRLSNFMCYEAAYAELVFSDVLWPDFDEIEFNKCLNEFQRRVRKFGGVS